MFFIHPVIFQEINMSWNPHQYEHLVEGNRDPIFQQYVRAEFECIKGVNGSKNRTFVDVGAGYGRILPHLTTVAGSVIAIELDANMASELEKRASLYQNVTVIEGDAQQLSTLLSQSELEGAIFLLLQNTLGTITGDWRRVLQEVENLAKLNHGEIVLSLLSQEALANWGIKLYRSLEEMTGPADLERTDFDAGIFRSKTGYVSKWWRIEERESFKTGTLLNEIKTHTHHILHMEYS